MLSGGYRNGRTSDCLLRFVCGGVDGGVADGQLAPGFLAGHLRRRDALDYSTQPQRTALIPITERSGRAEEHFRSCSALNAVLSPNH